MIWLWICFPCRTVDDIAREAEEGGLLGPSGPNKLNLVQAFSVRHHADLLGECPASDVQEILDTVLALLTELRGGRLSLAMPLPVLL